MRKINPIIREPLSSDYAPARALVRLASRGRALIPKRRNRPSALGNAIAGSKAARGTRLTGGDGENLAR